MKANLPTKLKVGSHAFTIVYTKAGDVGGKDDFGITDRGTNTIRIEEGLPYTQSIYVLFHEIFHAMNGELEEVLIASLAEQLTQVLLDNDMLR